MPLSIWAREKAIGRTPGDTGRPDVERSERRLAYLPGRKGRKPCDPSRFGQSGFGQCDNLGH